MEKGKSKVASEEVVHNDSKCWRSSRLTIEDPEMWSQVVKKYQVPKVTKVRKMIELGRNCGRGGKARASMREEKTNNVKNPAALGKETTTNAKNYVTVSMA